jgi:photoactive yellow protein
LHQDLGAIAFDSPDLLDALEAAALPALDAVPFGVITMDRNGDVIGYNTFESQRAGIDVSRVLGRNFFESVGPCTNNFLIAQRYLDDPDLDETIDFTFTLRMLPTPVRLRMLARAESKRQYLAVMNR